jgi:Domain of unknown function (DUF4390)
MPPPGTLFVNTMVSFTHFSKRADNTMAQYLEHWRDRLMPVLMVGALLLFGSLPGTAHAQGVRIDAIQLHKAEEGLQLSSTLGFDLPHPVQDALLKGIAVVFTAQVEILKDRWYWYDKAITSHVRQVRLSYQPLTKRWRVQMTDSTAGSDSGLSQHFDQLPLALSVVRRINHWKIADWSEIDTDARYTVEFRFRLDTTQLPRPFQIGAGASSDWNLNVAKSLRFTHDGRTEPPK